MLKLFLLLVNLLGVKNEHIPYFYKLTKQCGYLVCKYVFLIIISLMLVNYVKWENE